MLLLTKTLLRHHPLRDFVSALYNYTQPLEFCTFLICTWKRRALISQNHRFPSHNRHVSTLLHLLWWSRWRSRDWPSASVGEENISWKHLHFRFTILKMESSRRWERWLSRLKWQTQANLYLDALLTRWTYSCVERYGYCIHTTSCWVDTTIL